MDLTYSVFPKFFKHLDVAGLAAMVREVGLDTVNLVIRDGYWVTREGLAREAPAFVKAMADEGLQVRFATAGFDADEMLADPTPLKVLADAGIRDFRMGYFRAKGDAATLRGALDRARTQLEQLCPALERIGIRCVYQVHHGTLVPGPSGIYHLLRGLPAAVLGVMLDPGNQGFEGYEKWERAVPLLGEYLAAIGVKDTVVSRDASRSEDPNKGWSREFAPIHEGVVNWVDLVRALRGINFRGTFVWQPFYHQDQPDLMTEKLRHEVAYLRGIVRRVEAEADEAP